MSFGQQEAKAPLLARALNRYIVRDAQAKIQNSGKMSEL